MNQNYVPIIRSLILVYVDYLSEQHNKYIGGYHDDRRKYSREWREFNEYRIY
jgi:hypothetical protein